MMIVVDIAKDQPKGFNKVHTIQLNQLGNILCHRLAGVQTKLAGVCKVNEQCLAKELGESMPIDIVTLTGCLCDSSKDCVVP